MRFTDSEKAVVRRALADAITTAVHFDSFGPLAEYKPSKRKGWVTYDDDAVAQNATAARTALAKLLSGYWGLANTDNGIYAAAPTRSEALAKAGFATPHTRKRRGSVWVYTSAEGNEATIGRIADLLAQGFELLPAED